MLFAEQGACMRGKRIPFVVGVEVLVDVKSSRLSGSFSLDMDTFLCSMFLLLPYVMLPYHHHYLCYLYILMNCSAWLYAAIWKLAPIG